MRYRKTSTAEAHRNFDVNLARVREGIYPASDTGLSPGVLSALNAIALAYPNIGAELIAKATQEFAWELTERKRAEEE